MRKPEITRLRGAVLLALTLFIPAAASADTPASEEVRRVDHRIPIGSGKTVFVTEYFTQSSLLRKPARAVIFLAGPDFRGSFWSLPVEGYNASAMAARRGFFAYTMDYVGVGQSYIPENGSEVTYLTQVGPVSELIDFVRSSRQVPTVDLVGEGTGAAVAAQWNADTERVRSVTMSVTTYKTFNPAILRFFSPELESSLRRQPSGYWTPDFLDRTLGFSPNQKLRDYVYATQPGIYPTGPALGFWDAKLPIIDAPAARVPGLVISAEFDPFPAPGDNAELAADWGAGASHVTILGAHHVPRIEAEEIAVQFYDALFGFIDP